MRILQLVEHLWLGGSERMSVNISNVLQTEGYEVVLCPTHDKGPLEKFVNPNVRLICLNKRGTFDLKAFIRLLLVIRQNRIELIHAHSSSIFWAVAAKVFFPKVKIIWHDHYGYSEKLRDSDRKGIKLISYFFDAIIAVNETLQAWSIRNTAVRKENIVLINNFSVASNIPKHSQSGITKIVCLANLRPQKDHKTLIRAISIIRRQYPDIDLDVIFAGLYWQDEYYIGLMQLISELGLSNTVKIIGSVEDSGKLLASANIGVLSSNSEGLPISLLEYGLAGLPVVVTDVGQCCKVVENGKLGKVVPSGDYIAFAEELLWIIQNPVPAAKMGQELRTHINKEYGPDQFSYRYQRLLNGIFGACEDFCVN